MTRTAALIALLCVAALAGCGGGSRLSRADYTAKLAAVGKEADTTQAGIEKALKAKSVTELAAALNAFADAEDRLGDEVAKLKPPKDAQAANDELAKGEHDIARAVREVSRQVEKAPSVSAALKMVQTSEAAGAAGQEVDHALAVLKKLGYTKGS